MFKSFFRKRQRVLEKQQTINVRAAAEALFVTRSKNPSTKHTPEECRKAVEAHLLPALGERSIGSITRSEIEKIHDELEHAPATANLFLYATSEIFRFAETEGMRPKGTNPCIYVTAYPDSGQIK